MNFFDISGKNAVVVGGAGGFGQGCAEALAAAGCKVVISSRKTESLNRAAAEIKEATGKDVICIAADASRESEVKRLFEESVAALGKVDFLVNAQGFNKKHNLVDFPEDDWDQMFATNVKSMMLTAKYFGKHMKENGYGKIVNYSSVRGIRACGGGNVGYCSTKGAVDMLTRTCAVDLGPEVCVNAVGPTITYTPMMVGILPSDPVERAAKGAGKPLQRIGEIVDCVGPTLFLLSPASDFMTGQIIYPDGGLTAIG